MQDCRECRRLERQLEEMALRHYELARHVLSLDDSDPEKIWAGMALRGAKEAEEEAQRQFNEHQDKHAQDRELVGKA